jgi:hypothetical protein
VSTAVVFVVGLKIWDSISVLCRNRTGFIDNVVWRYDVPTIRLLVRDIDVDLKIENASAAVVVLVVVA